MKLKGLCHTCHSSNVKTELDEFKKPICISCREEKAATKRQQEDQN